MLDCLCALFQEKLEKSQSKKTSGRRRVPIQEVDSSSDDSDDSPVHTANKGEIDMAVMIKTKTQ